MADVSMPQLGETVAEGTVTKWFKKVGDVLRRGEPLFEVSTDKVDTEIPAPADGVLTAILVDEGTTVDVGTLLAVIGGDAEPRAAAATPRATGAQTPNPTTTAAPAPREVDAKLSPVVRRLLAEHDLDPSQIAGTGPNGRVTREDVVAAARQRFVASRPSAPPLSPVVRRLLVEHGLDASSITGSGTDGRLTRRNVEDAIATGGDVVVPFTRIRRVTAEHMVRSKATSAHTLMVREVDYENVESVRRGAGPTFKETEGFSLTYLPFNAAAAIAALGDFPHLNASVGNDALVVHRGINLSVAVDLDDEGLVAPVVHGAGRMDLRSLARSIRDVATRARAKSLAVDDFSGGTFTITNPGPFGTLLTGAIINQPQVAILSTDAVTRRPVVITDAAGVESVGIHSTGLLALTFDHRAVDGAYAARFLARMSEILATRDWASEL